MGSQKTCLESSYCLLQVNQKKNKSFMFKVEIPHKPYKLLPQRRAFRDCCSSFHHMSACSTPLLPWSKARFRMISMSGLWQLFVHTSTCVCLMFMFHKNRWFLNSHLSSSAESRTTGCKIRHECRIYGSYEMSTVGPTVRVGA